jgi:hypothetical protein
VFWLGAGGGPLGESLDKLSPSKAPLSLLCELPPTTVYLLSPVGRWELRPGRFIGNLVGFL